MILFYQKIAPVYYHNCWYKKNRRNNYGNN